MSQEAERFPANSLKNFKELGYTEDLYTKAKQDVYPPVKRAPVDGFSGAEYNPTKWPAHSSWYKKCDMCIKSDIPERFCLNDMDDIADLYYLKRTTIDGQREYHLYLCQELERRGWEKYGGPSGLQAALERLHGKPYYPKLLMSSATYPQDYCPWDFDGYDYYLYDGYDGFEDYGYLPEDNESEEDEEDEDEIHDILHDEDDQNKLQFPDTVRKNELQTIEKLVQRYNIKWPDNMVTLVYDKEENKKPQVSPPKTPERIKDENSKDAIPSSPPSGPVHDDRPWKTESEEHSGLLRTLTPSRTPTPVVSQGETDTERKRQRSGDDNKNFEGRITRQRAKKAKLAQ